MDPADTAYALRSALQDQKDGADVLMVKPALPYLDIFFRLKQATRKPGTGDGHGGVRDREQATGVSGGRQPREQANGNKTTREQAAGDAPPPHSHPGMRTGDGQVRKRREYDDGS